MNNNTAVEQFSQMIQEAQQRAEKIAPEKQHGVVIDISFLEDPASLPPEFWEKLQNWADLPSTQNWLEFELQPGKRTSYGYVTDVKEVTTASGVRRVDVKYINNHGQPMGFVYSSTSESPEVARLQQLEPEGFKKGDIIAIEQEDDKVLSRTKIRDNDTLNLAKAKILLGMKKI